MVALILPNKLKTRLLRGSWYYMNVLPEPFNIPKLQKPWTVSSIPRHPSFPSSSPTSWLLTIQAKYTKCSFRPIFKLMNEIKEKGLQ